MRRRALFLLALLGALAALGAPAAGAAEAPASVTQIEGEVMCPVCGTLLELAESPQALREKAFVKRLVGEGKTASQVKDALVAEYGEAVLALPQGSGFDLSAYLVPIIAFIVALVAIAIGVLRWRRSGGGSGGDGGPGAGGPSRADSERLDADLARYDL